MFLVTTAWTTFWEGDQELLLLGPWCMPYRRTLEGVGSRYRILKNPWDDRERLGQALQYTRGVREHLLAELTQYLNSVHGVSHNCRYWNILLGPWLLYHVPDLYSRFVHVTEAIRAFPSLTTCRLAPECYVTPRDTRHWLFLFNVEAYPLQLFSQVTEFLGLPATVRGAPRPPIQVADRMTKERMVDRAVSAALQWLRSLGRCHEIVIDGVYLTKTQAFQLFWNSGFRGVPLRIRVPQTLMPQPLFDECRRGLSGLRARDEFERLLIAQLPINFPSLFLEGYEMARDFCLERAGRVPNVVLSSVGWAVEEGLKILAAESNARGGRLAGVQHGAAYGIQTSLPWLDWELAITDRWYAWGWAGLAESSKIRNLPDPRLSSLARSSRALGTDIFYVPTETHPNILRLQFIPMGNQVVEYLDWQLRFIRSLTGSEMARVVVQPYPHDLGWNQVQRLTDAVPGLRVRKGKGHFTDELQRARLVVVDHLGTAVLEALVSGVPCVMFWNPAHWETIPAAAPYTNALRRAGILFDDPEAAAKQVVRIYADPEGWWRSEPVRSAREAFVERFALSDPRWVEAWVRELNREAALSRIQEPDAGTGSGRRGG